MLVLSLPHSGTHFITAFLEAAPGVDGKRGTAQLRDGPIPEGTFLFWGHFDPTEWYFMGRHIREGRPIVPVRDPLLVAISHHVRRSHMDVANWARASVVMDAHVAHYVPLDLLRTEEERLPALRATLRACGIDRGDSINYCRKWARTWESLMADPAVSGTVGHTDHKTEYQNGNFAYLAHDMPERIATLKEHERSLRPWLERIGYRDLMWWS